MFYWPPTLVDTTTTSYVITMIIVVIIKIKIINLFFIYCRGHISPPVYYVHLL